MFIRIIYCILIAIQLLKQSDGKAPERIIGGSNAAIDEFPSIVSIRFNKRHICGGVFISMKHILTAAHCVVNENLRTRKLNYLPPKSFEIASGSHDCHKPLSVNKVANILVHPEYLGVANDHINDIAILVLSRRVAESSTQKPIHLPSEPYKFGNVAGFVIGWGTEYPRGKPNEILQKAPTELLTTFSCQIKLADKVYESQLCGYQSFGIGFCDGDSGGPLIVNNEIVGIVSMSYDCGAGYPDIYTRVYSYLPWIEKQIK